MTGKTAWSPSSTAAWQCKRHRKIQLVSAINFYVRAVRVPVSIIVMDGHTPYKLVVIPSTSWCTTWYNMLEASSHPIRLGKRIRLGSAASEGLPTCTMRKSSQCASQTASR